MTTRGRHCLAWSLVLTLFAVGCSSTTAHRSKPKPGETVSAPTADGELTSGGATGEPNSRSAAARRDDNAGPSAANGQPAAGRTNGSASAQKGGAVEVGTFVYTNVEGFSSALGLEGLELGDTEGQIRAIVAHINNHGGFLGRKIVPIIFKRDSTSTSAWAAEHEAACAMFTEDHHVVAAALHANKFNDVLEECLHKHRVPLIRSSSGNFGLKEHLNRFPLLVPATYLTMDRAYRLLIRRLQAQGYFAADAKIGLLRFNTPQHKRVAETIIKPELSRVGRKLTDEFVFTTPRSTAELGDNAAEAQSAQLRFRQQGITHVIIEDIADVIPLFFMPSAESNGYRPRYALTSDSVPSFIAENVPPEQLHRTVGIGWGFDDGLSGEDPGTYNATSKLCRDILVKAGQEPIGLGMTYCDFFLFLQTVFARGGALTAEAFLAGVHGLGTSFQAGGTFGTRFSPSKHDGPAFVRDIAFVDSCECFRFRSGNVAVP